MKSINVFNQIPCPRDLPGVGGLGALWLELGAPLCGGERAGGGESGDWSAAQVEWGQAQHSGDQGWASRGATVPGVWGVVCHQEEGRGSSVQEEGSHRWQRAQETGRKSREQMSCGKEGQRLILSGRPSLPSASCWGSLLAPPRSTRGSLLHLPSPETQMWRCLHSPERATRTPCCLQNKLRPPPPSSHFRLDLFHTLGGAPRTKS